MNRRTFIQLLSQSGLMACWETSSATDIVKQLEQKTPGETLHQYFQTLIPADETPGAIELGIPQKIIQHASLNPRYQRLLVFAEEWLDNEARTMSDTIFSKLELTLREKIVTTMEHADITSIERFFFNRSRRDAMTLYYSDPRIRQTFAYARPPQPLGFKDFDKPPAIQP